MESEEYFSLKLTKGNRTYFFDIKESIAGNLYLKISESKKVEHGFERHHLMVFEEDLDQFADTFQRALRKLYECKGSKNVLNNSAGVSLNPPLTKSYNPWTSADDDKLESLYCEGIKLDELAEILKRSLGAVKSRIKKLQLEEKYSIPAI